jgi:vitamin B12 transporter
MRPARLLFLFLIVSLAARAADLKVKVVDPRSAVVAGAQVALYPVAGSQALALQNSSPEGIAGFTALKPGNYRLEVLAPGFAPAKLEVHVPAETSVEVHLTVAGPEQTVVVTATRTPMPAEESGASVALLDAQALEDMQPVAANDALRFLPGAVVNTAGQRGGLASLFVRGGESRYNKVIIDGVPVNEPGGIFDFGVVPLTDVDRMEFVRGPSSVLYGSDAMTSVVQTWSATGHTRVPELRFGADGGTFGTGQGFASLAGARGGFDYNLFGSQDATNGQGPNDEYSNSLQGANLGAMLSPKVAVRLRTRHTNSRSGVPGEWNFNGTPLLAPDVDAFARQNNFLASAEINVSASPHWQHGVSGFEYNHRGTNQDLVPDRGCDFVTVFLDCPFQEPFSVNRAGFDYQGDYSPRAWTHTTFGYEFEDENGVFNVFDYDLKGNLIPPPSSTRGLRRNQAAYAEQMLNWRRWSLMAGVRYVHNESFGNKAVPQAAVSFLALRGGDVFSGTRLRFAHSEGIQEPSFQESFGITGTFLTIPNPNLRPEQNRSIEAGVQQNLFGGKSSLAATYFNNLFRDQIAFETVNPTTFVGEYFNINRSFAHGAELESHTRLRNWVAVDAAYVYTSTQILSAPGAFPPYATGEPLLRRPKHSGSLLLNYFGKRWGGDVGGSFVGRRPDSDFLGLGIDHAAGYALVNTGGWYAINRYMTAYVNVENVLNRSYNEVVGYPALKANFRAGMRFRVGGE